ncbi:hypothetical protein TIFTF001_040217 [Ficus carica]|uniref:Uncharacterized protein n=1 Tax=Ficus carica TaxID=3494 RepID=A0AA87YUC1_FICCA|nr:hypothetical protein TIFTF001_040217 [Ficus carica]
MRENFLFSSLTNHFNYSEFSVALTIDLSNGFPPPFVASATIPRFLFAGRHWVAVFYTKVRVTIQATGRGCHPNLIVERSWKLLRLRVSSQVGVVHIIWYQIFGSSLSSLTNHFNLSEFSVAITIDLSNGFPPPFVASTTIPRFLFAVGHWVTVFYTKIRVTIQATGRGCHPNLIVERSWRLLKLQVSSQVGVVQIIWYQSFGSSLSSLTNHLNLSEFSVAFTIDLSNGFPPPFVASTTIPRFLFAGRHWVAVFYTKVRFTIQATGRGCHPNLIVERSWRLLRLRVSSQVGVFFDEPFKLIGIFHGVHYRLIKRISTTVCGVCDNTKVLVCGWTLGRGLLYQGSCHDSSNRSWLPSKPECRTILETS